MKRNAKLYSILFLAIFCGAIILSSPHTALSQDSTPSPTPADSDELKNLKDKNAILDEKKKAAESEKAIAEANKAKFDAEFPKPTTKPLEGNTTVDGEVKIESQMMAHHALRTVANSIADDIIRKQSDITNLAIYNSQTLKTIQSYSATRGQLDLISQGYDKILVRPRAATKVASNNNFNFNKLISAPHFTVADSVLGAFIDLMALLRTDTDVKGLSFDVGESVAVSEVFRSLKSKNKLTNLYYPLEFPPNIVAQTSYEILGQIEELNDQKTKAEELITAIEENEKKYKEELANKEKLEARKKQLPKDLTAAREELKKNQGIYKKFPSAELLGKIEDGKNLIKKLIQEQDVELPNSINSNAVTIKNLELKLEELYRRIRRAIDIDDLRTGVKRINESIAETANEFLGRSYTIDELEEFVGGISDTNKNKLLAEAKKHTGKDLTSAEKDKLLHPVDNKRLSAFVVIASRLQTPGSTLSQSEINKLLAEDQQLRLAYPTDAEVGVEEKILEKEKSTSITKLKALNAQFDKFYQDVIKVDAASGINPITSYLQAENLMNALGCEAGECDGAYMLELHVIKAGGNNRTKKNLIADVFTGANISHSGGAIVEYKLYDMTGKVTASSVCYAYEYYRRSKAISSLSAANNPSSTSCGPMQPAPATGEQLAAAKSQ